MMVLTRNWNLTDLKSQPPSTVIYRKLWNSKSIDVTCIISYRKIVMIERSFGIICILWSDSVKVMCHIHVEAPNVTSNWSSYFLRNSLFEFWFKAMRVSVLLFSGYNNPIRNQLVPKNEGNQLITKGATILVSFFTTHILIRF